MRSNLLQSVLFFNLMIVSMLLSALVNRFSVFPYVGLFFIPSLPPFTYPGLRTPPTAIPRCDRQYSIPLDQRQRRAYNSSLHWDEFTQIPAVAQGSSTSDGRDRFPSLSQPSPIQLIFCPGQNKFAF